MSINKSTGTMQRALEGLVDGLFVKFLWNKESQESEKNIPYLAGNLAACYVNPMACSQMIYDLLVGNYRS